MCTGFTQLDVFLQVGITIVLFIFLSNSVLAVLIEDAGVRRFEGGNKNTLYWESNFLRSQFYFLAHRSIFHMHVKEQ